MGLQVREFKKGALKMKVWDLGGQQSYRSEWARYARGVDVIVFVLDAADAERLSAARKELHRLLEDPALARTPLLIAANKIDLTPHLSEEEVVKVSRGGVPSGRDWVTRRCHAESEYV